MIPVSQLSLQATQLKEIATNLSNAAASLFQISGALSALSASSISTPLTSPIPIPTTPTPSIPTPTTQPSPLSSFITNTPTKSNTPTQPITSTKPIVPTQLLSLEELAAVRKQIEFYFSDSNLGKDRYLKQQIDINPEGWVPLSLFLRFNKLKNLTSDLKLLAQAVEGSAELLLSHDRTSVKRLKPVVERQDTDQRTIYVEKLPPNSTHESVKNQFSPYGNVLYVSLPRSVHGSAKGFSFIEYDSVNEAQKVLEKFKSGGFPELNIMSKTQWLERKSQTKALSNTLGGVVQFSISNSNLSRIDARRFFQQVGYVAYVDFTIGQNSGYVRYRNKEDAKKCVQTLQSKLIGEHPVSLKLLEGEEEKRYFDQMQNDKTLNSQNHTPTTSSTSTSTSDSTIVSSTNTSKNTKNKKRSFQQTTNNQITENADNKQEKDQIQSPETKKFKQDNDKKEIQDTAQKEQDKEQQSKVEETKNKGTPKATKKRVATVQPSSSPLPSPTIVQAQPKVPPTKKQRS